MVDGKNEIKTEETKRIDIKNDGIKPCGCKSEFQDRIYGPGLRAMNHKSDGGLRCTVCNVTYGGTQTIRAK